MSPFLSDISSALAHGDSFSASKSKTGEWRVKRRSLWNRFFFWKDRDYHLKRIGQIAKVLNQEIRDLPRMKISAAVKDDSLKVARKFLRSLNPQQLSEPHVSDCCRQLLAAKLGVEVGVFSANPEFEEFALKSHLERYLSDYDHEIRVNPENQQISLMFEGKYQTWEVIKDQINLLPLPEKNHPDNPRQMWLYGQNGVQKRDMYAWTKLTPYKVVKPDWGNRYLFEFTVCCNPSFGLNGDHSWLELKTPQGEIYSVGLYRPGKTRSIDTFHTPLRVKKGYLMSPDVSVWWPTPIHRIPVEITKEQFKKIKTSIESDKMNEENRHFQLFNGNCQEYVNEKAKIAGIDLKTSTFVLRNITPIKWQKIYDKTMRYLPKLVHKIFYISATIFLNILHWILGGSIVDKDLKVKGVEVKPLIRSFRDLFNPQKLYFHPPRYTGLILKKEIEEWRMQEDPESSRRYRLPSECLMSS